MSLRLESDHYLSYLDHASGVKKQDGALGKVYDLISDITDREALKEVWKGIDGKVQDEIIDDWIKIIQ